MRTVAGRIGFVFLAASFAVCVFPGLSQESARPAARPASRGAKPAVAFQSAAGNSALSPANGATAPANDAAHYREMVAKYCVTCHSQRAKIPAGAPLALDALDIEHVERNAETWEKVVRKMGIGAMPPQGSPRPPAQELNAFQAWLAASLDRAAEANGNPGRFVLHRLNRAEYANAVRDLLGLDVDITEYLPADGSDFGFDNVATALPVSPALLERYLTTAVRITALSLGDTKAERAEEVFAVRADVNQEGHVEGLPLGTRGGTSVHYNFPADGDYELAGLLYRPVDNADAGIEGNDVPNQFDILIDGARIHSALIGGPEDHVKSRGNLSAARDAVAARMRVRVTLPAGPHDIGFTFVERPAHPQDIFEPNERSSQDIHVGSGLPKLRAVSITGPLAVQGISETPSRRRIFTCRPNSAATEASCAKEILSGLATRAYRRPVTDTDLAPIMKFYNDGHATGDFEGGIRAALPRILASPSFLFRSEADDRALPDGAPHPVTDLELASRLSFFLWSTVPDDELLRIAQQNRLRAPGVLEQQVKRMLADPRSEALVTNFPDQWLALRNLERAAPDILMFPQWDLTLQKAMQRETELLFASVVRENRSTLTLLDADYTFVNERLARHYGIPNVYGTNFRRVSISDPNRRGLLGQGSILTLTSVATRTSPVFRGKWILTNLLNVPPLPPPPNVPALAENGGSAAPRSVRERLEAHRANAVCASCHRNMDPIGFALENFNAVGQWRPLDENGKPVDASGQLVDGSMVNGPVALRRALLARPNVFAGTVTEKLMIYALGRGLEAYDMPVVRQIVRDASQNDYKLQSIIMGIVESKPFQMRANLAVADAGAPSRVNP